MLVWSCDSYGRGELQKEVALNGRNLWETWNEVLKAKLKMLSLTEEIVECAVLKKTHPSQKLCPQITLIMFFLLHNQIPAPPSTLPYESFLKHLCNHLVTIDMHFSLPVPPSLESHLFLLLIPFHWSSPPFCTFQPALPYTYCHSQHPLSYLSS